MLFLVNGREILFKWTHILTALILGLFVYIVGTDLQYNTAFVDEAIYANVGEEFMRNASWDAPLSWMGGSYVYPFLSANINRLWGLWGIRLASLAMVLGSAWCVGILGKKVADGWGRPLAMGLFLFSAPTLGVAQLATYDAPSMLAFALGSLALFASIDEQGWKKYLGILVSGLLVGGSILIKYVTVLVTAPLALLHLSAKRQWLLGGFFWGWIILAMVAPYVYLNYEDLYSYATGGHSIENTSRLNILSQLVQQIPTLVFGAIMACAMLWKSETRMKKNRMLILFLIGLAPIAYHLGSGNIRSFNKHLSLAGVMWAPLTAWATLTLLKLFRKYQQVHGAVANSMQLITSVVLIAIFTSLWTAFSLHWQFERSWPSANKTVEYLDNHLVTGDKVFAEGAATYKYHLFRGFGDYSAWPSTWYYEKDGKLGAEAMKEAIAEREFRYIVLNNYFTNATNQEILPVVREHYETVAQEEYLLSGVHETTTTVWERKPQVRFGFLDLLVKAESDSSTI